MTRSCACLAVCILLGSPQSFAGQGEAEENVGAFVDFDLRRPPTAPNHSPFEIDLATDLPILLTGALVGAAPLFMDLHVGRDVRNLDPGELNRLDRSVLGNWSPTANQVSDFTLAATISLPILLNFLDVMTADGSDGLPGFGKDTLILLETMAVHCTASNLSKFTVRRPRPYAYIDRLDLETRSENNAALSFFSGHTSLSFSMATAYSYLFTKRHPDSAWVVPVWIGSHALAATTAYLRVRAGKHFWSDVIVGSAVGSAIGFLVPYLHTRRQDGEGLPGQLMVTPLFYEGGFGASATWVF